MEGGVTWGTTDPVGEERKAEEADGPEGGGELRPAPATSDRDHGEDITIWRSKVGDGNPPGSATVRPRQ